MTLPNEITTSEIRRVSDMCDCESIDDAMCEYFAEVIDALTVLYGLTQEQRDELDDRICWRLELLPVPPGPSNAALAS